MRVTRRGFLGASAALGATITLGRYFGSRKFNPQELFSTAAVAKEAENVRYVKSVCSHCAVGCGFLGKVKNGVFVGIEPWKDHPINRGSLCSKGASIAEIVNCERRLKYPMEKKAGKWSRISWDEAMDKVATKMAEIRKDYGPDSVMWMGSAKTTNEECYLFRKMAAFWGTNNVDHQARICHSTTVAGLANTWGFGAQTNNMNDMRHCKCIFYMGSNACEAHPVSMKHAMVAKERGAKIIVADPRFTRTAAKADIYARFRPGTDIPLLLGLCRIIIKNKWYDEYMVNNRTIGFEDLKEVCKSYTPEVVEDITWVPKEKLYLIAKTLYENKPGTIVWAMGQTQHTVGTNNIHSSAILMLILGDAARSGGGCQPFRGHDNVQGATDMCILSHSLPSYYGLSEKAWRHWCTVWGIPYEEMVKRFASKKLMGKPGFTVARWYEGAILPEEKIDQPHNIKMVFVWGHSLNSISEMKQLKKGLEKVDLVVGVDPHSTIASSLPDRKDGIIVLPASTVFEEKGSVTTSGRQVQWRNQIVKPLWDSKPDMWIMEKLATKLEEKTGLAFKKYFTYNEPEEVTEEFLSGMLWIGMIGQKPARLKRQQEHCSTFDIEDTRAKSGPCKGEYWGLPWPCWTDTHCGTPLLYDSSKAVKDGGHDIRAKWGSKVPVNKTGKHIGDSLLRGDHPVPQATYNGVKYGLDLSLTAIRQALAKGEPPTGRGRARIWAWNLPDPVPVHREPIESPRPDLIEKYPTYKDKPKFYRVLTKYRTLQQQRKDLVDKYPIVLSSGRQVEHMGGGAETRSCPYLVELSPCVYVEIHPNLATKIGVKNGEFVWVETLRGRCRVKAMVTKRAAYDKLRKVAYIPYHWAGVFEGKSYVDRYPKNPDGSPTAELAVGDSVNIITVDGYDATTQMQETKVCLCKVYKA